MQGINIDFESLAGSDRARFTAFVQQLTNAAHAKNLTVSIDLPRGSLSWNHLTAFDHNKLGQIVDYVIIMAYDQHYRSSPTPGSVAGMQWTEQGVIEFLSYGIPRDKLILGIPFYVREWKLDSANNIVSNRAIFTSELEQLIAEKNASMTWDPRFSQFKVAYTDGGFTHVFWLENNGTLQARIDIAKKYDLAGLAAWRLGYEPESFWMTLLRAK